MISLDLKNSQQLNLVFKTIGEKEMVLYTVTADLTIKEITNPVTFDITVKGNTATTAFKVDRTKYDIKYGSGIFLWFRR